MHESCVRENQLHPTARPGPHSGCLGGEGPRFRTTQASAQDRAPCSASQKWASLFQGPVSKGKSSRESEEPESQVTEAPADS